MYEAQEVTGASVISFCDTPEVFEFVEASLDGVSDFISLEVVRDRPFPGWIAGDDGFSAHAGDKRAQGV